MPISLWILCLIKNTAADTGIQEAKRVKRKRNKKKGESETESKGENPDVIRKGTELEK